MTQFALAARSHIRNVLLCTLATMTLAACGGESDSGSAAATSAASDTAASLVSPGAGMIDRPQSVDTTSSVSASPVTTPAPNTTIQNPTPVSGPTTVASSNKSGTPVKATTPATPTTGVATLDWMPPTQNSDGTVLTNLAGYTVYYGTSASNLTQSVKVTNPGLAAYTITNLTSGTWYFAVTSISADGVESTRTGTVSATI